MIIRCLIVACLASFAAILISGCGDQPTGACVRGSGMTAGCGDDYTAGQCDIINGTMYEGVTCAELGFGKSEISRLVISEIYRKPIDRGGEIGWIELLNAGLHPVDLTGFTLVCRTADEQDASFVLDGVIDGCGMFVLGAPDSGPDNGLPRLDQVADLSAALPDLDSEIEMVALYRPGDSPETVCPLTAIILGSRSPSILVENGCSANISAIGPVAPGFSVARESWPAETWLTSSRPDPNLVNFVLGCTSRTGLRSSWTKITGVYH